MIPGGQGVLFATVVHVRCVSKNVTEMHEAGTVREQCRELSVQQHEHRRKSQDTDQLDYQNYGSYFVT